MKKTCVDLFAKETADGSMSLTNSDDGEQSPSVFERVMAFHKSAPKTVDDGILDSESSICPANKKKKWTIAAPPAQINRITVALGANPAGDGGDDSGEATPIIETLPHGSVEEKQPECSWEWLKAWLATADVACAGTIDWAPWGERLRCAPPCQEWHLPVLCAQLLEHHLSFGPGAFELQVILQGVANQVGAYRLLKDYFRAFFAEAMNEFDSRKQQTRIDIFKALYKDTKRGRTFVNSDGTARFLSFANRSEAF